MNIDNKIRADLFRNRIEDKNQLTGAGAIYVGTGIPKYISSTGAITGAPLTGTIGPFYETVGVTPTTGGQVPVSVMGTGSAEATGTVAGLEFKSVNDAMKGENGSILLAANGMNVRSSNGITFLNEDAANTDISITNKMRDISVNAAQNVSIEGKTKTKISNISLDTTLNGPLTGNLYTAPSGTPSLSTTGVTDTYSSDTSEKNLVPILYNVGQRLSSAEERLNSLGFKGLGGNFDSAFEFELKKSYIVDGVTKKFTLGTLKIAPQDVMGNYCRAVVKFEPVQIDKVKLIATEYVHASGDDQRRLLFYCGTYFLYEPPTQKIFFDTGESDFSYKNMNRFNNTVITPAEEIEFSFPLSIDVYSTYEGGDLVLEAASIIVHFVLTPPGADGQTRVQMKIHSQNFNAIAQTYRIRIPGKATIDPFPIIAYKRKI